MRLRVVSIVILLIGCDLTSVLAGISASSFDTQAQANAYAPLDKSGYFAVDDKPSTSPALTDVSGDWTGTNLGASETTWHMVTFAHLQSSTIFDPSQLAITGAGSFSYEVSTSNNFTDPARGAARFVPGADASYGCRFTTDVSTLCQLSADLNRLGGITLKQIGGPTIFDSLNLGTLPKPVAFTTTLSPSEYQLSFGANHYGPAPLPDGINDFTSSGGISNVVVSVQIPEAVTAGAVVILSLGRRNHYGIPKLIAPSSSF